MTQSQQAYQAHAGDFLQHYKPKVNLNTITNVLLTSPQAIFAPAIITTEEEFPDVSFYQGEIDFDVMKTKTRAIILRAGQNTWKDTSFDRNYAEAKRAGLLVGAYWFYDDRASPGAQADKLKEVLAGRALEMEVYVDWENSYGGAFKGLANVVAMMQRVESFGLRIKDVGMYTGYYWFRENTNPVANAGQYSYLKDKPLWEAWYTNSPSDVLIPAPWTKLLHWQFGTPAVDWGQQSKEIDMNYFNGTKQEFMQRYSTGETPMDYVELKSNVAGEYRSLRQQTAYPTVPHIDGARVGQINVGNVGKAFPTSSYTYTSNITANGIVKAMTGDIWWKVYEANGVSISGWVAEIHLGKRWMTTRLVTDTTPPPPPPTLPTLQIEVSDTDGLYTPVTVELKPK